MVWLFARFACSFVFCLCVRIAAHDKLCSRASFHIRHLTFHFIFHRCCNYYYCWCGYFFMFLFWNSLTHRIILHPIFTSQPRRVHYYQWNIFFVRKYAHLAALDTWKKERANTFKKTDTNKKIERKIIQRMCRRHKLNEIKHSGWHKNPVSFENESIEQCAVT